MNVFRRSPQKIEMKSKRCLKNLATTQFKGKSKQTAKTSQNYFQKVKIMEDLEDLDWSQMFEEEINKVENALNTSPEQPQKKRQRLEQPANFRQFPGPAGILPKIEVDSHETALKFSKMKPKRRSAGEQESIICQEEDEEDVGLSKEDLIDDNVTWQAIQDDKDFTEEYFKVTSEDIKNKAKFSDSSIKVPLFCCVIKSIDVSTGLDPTCEFIDPKGTVMGNIHRDVIQNHGEKLKPGKFCKYFRHFLPCHSYYFHSFC